MKNAITIRLLLVVFWVTLFYGLLRLPAIVQHWSEENTLNILAWPASFNAEFLGEFEKEMGVKIRVSYFENNEELFIKMKSGKKTGYDLIMPSDYVVRLLKKEGLLKKIDKTKLNFFNDIYPTLKNLSFDPHNEYTIPYVWMVFGLGINKQAFPQGMPEASWDLIFKPQSFSIGMLDDAREVVSIASLYLFGKQQEKLDESNWLAIKELLKKQKSFVTMYTDMRADYLLTSKTAAVVVTNSADIGRVMRLDNNIEFLVPREGSFLVIDSFAMPRESTKEKTVYKFLNFLYHPDTMNKYAKKFGFVPVLQDVTQQCTMLPFCSPSENIVGNLHFFKSDLPEKILSSLWIELKA